MNEQEKRFGQDEKSTRNAFERAIGHNPLPQPRLFTIGAYLNHRAEMLRANGMPPDNIAENIIYVEADMQKMAKVVPGVRP